MTGPPDLPELPEEARRQVFADNLKRRIRVKGWNQSELARRAGLARDNISKYCRARVIPLLEQMDALCRALKCTPRDLVPPRQTNVEHPSFLFQQLSDGNVWLRVNQAVSLTVALKIAALLDEKTDA